MTIAGRRVLVTRAAHQAGKLSHGLRALGIVPVEVPVLEIQPPETLAPLDHALKSLATYDWLILTSANTVNAMAGRAAALGLALGSSQPKQTAAVGDATAKAARQAGFEVSLVPETYVAESLVQDILQGGDFHRTHEASGRDFRRADRAGEDAGTLAAERQLQGKRVLLARAAVARDVIPDALRAAGAQVDVVDAYQNAMPLNAPALLHAALEQGIDAATFTSSSSVTHLADAARAAGLSFPFAGVAAISIGPITSQTLRELGWEPAIEANPSDIPGLIAAAAELLTR